MRINLNSYDRIQWPVKVYIFVLELRKWTCKLMLWTSRRRWFLLVSMEQVKNHCFLPLVWEGLMKFHCFFGIELDAVIVWSFWKNPSRFFFVHEVPPCCQVIQLEEINEPNHRTPPTKKQVLHSFQVLGSFLLLLPLCFWDTLGYWDVVNLPA